MNYYIAYKKLRKDCVEIRIDDLYRDIRQISTVRIYGPKEWARKINGEQIAPQTPAFTYKLDRQVSIFIKPDPCTPTLSVFEIDLKVVNHDPCKDETPEEKITIHTLFLNDLSLFKAKNIYLEGLNKGACGNGCGSFCNNCAEYKDLLGLMTLMLRMSILKDAYVYDNETLTLNYYKDLQRFIDMDRIPFSTIEMNKEYYSNPERLHDLYYHLNGEIKHNVSPCVKKMYESIILSDLYDLLFSVTDRGGKAKWILEDRVWNMNDEVWFNNKIWKN